eukprot:935290-Amorphochlora_amoeboformis.AAC.1
MDAARLERFSTALLLSSKYSTKQKKAGFLKGLRGVGFGSVGESKAIIGVALRLCVGGQLKGAKDGLGRWLRREGRGGRTVGKRFQKKGPDIFGGKEFPV